MPCRHLPSGERGEGKARFGVQQIAPETPLATPFRFKMMRLTTLVSLLAGAAASKSVRLFNMRTRTESKPVLRHDKDVIALAFSPDGRLLATASKDQSLHVWDLQSRDLARPPIRRKTEYTAVRFSPMANSCSPRLGAAPHSFGAPTPADTRPWN